MLVPKWCRRPCTLGGLHVVHEAKGQQPHPGHRPGEHGRGGAERGVGGGVEKVGGEVAALPRRDVPARPEALHRGVVVQLVVAAVQRVERDLVWNVGQPRATMTSRCGTAPRGRHAATVARLALPVGGLVGVRGGRRDGERERAGDGNGRDGNGRWAAFMQSAETIKPSTPCRRGVHCKAHWALHPTATATLSPGGLSTNCAMRQP